MKYIFNNGKVALIAQGNEFHKGKPSKDKEGEDYLQSKTYYYDPACAVRAVAKDVAGEEAADLWEWLAVYNEVCETVIKELKGDANVKDASRN